MTLTIDDAIRGMKHFRGWDLEIEAIEALIKENAQLRHRLRCAAQTIIEEIGASGPEDAEESAVRAVAEIKQLRQKLAEAKEVVGLAQRLLESHEVDAPQDVADYNTVMDYRTDQKGGE